MSTKSVSPPGPFGALPISVSCHGEKKKYGKIEKIKSTKWGVSDSIAVKLFHENYSKKINIKNKN